MKQQLLVVDSNEMMRSFLSHYFAKHFHVKAVADIEAAWRFLDAGSYPDLILMDISLPQQSGLDFLKQLKESILFNDIPVFILSSEDKSSSKVECLLAGAADYLTKPFNPKELEIRVQNRLKTYAVLS